MLFDGVRTDSFGDVGHLDEAGGVLDGAVVALPVLVGVEAAEVGERLTCNEISKAQVGKGYKARSTLKPFNLVFFVPNVAFYIYHIVTKIPNIWYFLTKPIV